MNDGRWFTEVPSPSGSPLSTRSGMGVGGSEMPRKEGIMERYRNLGGDSGVTAYEIGTNYIKVQFSDGAVYLYNYQSAGNTHIERMKELAVAGRGLNSYINQFVRKGYASRLR